MSRIVWDKIGEHLYETGIEKGVFETSKRVCSSLMINKYDTQKIIMLLAKYYKIEYHEVIDIIREIEFNALSKKYHILYVQCLGSYYLDISKIK